MSFSPFPAIEVRHIIPISGKDSLATCLVQRASQPDLPYEYMFNPTGAELPEVLDWLAHVEVYLGEPIVRVGANLSDLIAANGYFLPSIRDRYCTRESKIQPMERWLGKEPATVYYGIRADEDRGGYNNATAKHITPAYPLKEQGIDLAGVYAINAAAGLKPPTFFWKLLFDLVCQYVPESFIRAKLTEWQFDALFGWRTRANCHYCFNQRLYEWVGLLQHHPDLFWLAEAMEHMGSEYTWNSNLVSLKQIAERAESITRKRATAIVKLLNSGQMDLFNDDFIDVLAVTSCGLLCGK